MAKNNDGDLPPKPRAYTPAKERPPRPPEAWWIEADFRKEIIEAYLLEGIIKWKWVRVAGYWDYPGRPIEISAADLKRKKLDNWKRGDIKDANLLDAIQAVQKYLDEHPEEKPTGDLDPICKEIAEKFQLNSKKI